jgi:ABC-type glycerol-3-phosphate transport system substrate-binding protein
MSTFQTALLMIFGAMLITGTLIFSGILPGFRGSSGASAGTVVMWGILPDDAMDEFVRGVNKTYGESFFLEYQAKDRATFEAQFVEALAAGTGPDLILTPHDLLARAENKLLPISVETLPTRTFQDTFIDVADVLISNNGYLAMPVAVDPLVMYYNKNILSSSGLATPPRLWSEFTNPQRNIIDAMTVTNERNAIEQGAVAMGETNNIKNLKDILSMLIMQAGNPIVTRDPATGGLKVTLQENFSFAEKPAVAAVNFFTQFSNPAKVTYSWNSAQPEAQDAFVAGKLGLYFGRASEYSTIKLRNPHLSFDVAIPPQRTKLDNRTYGTLYSVAVVKSTTKPAGAITAALALSSAQTASELAAIFKLPAVRQDIIEAGSDNPTMALFNKAALISYTWLDPNPVETSRIFSTMIQDVTSGRDVAASAVTRAHSQMETLIKP